MIDVFGSDQLVLLAGGLFRPRLHGSGADELLFLVVPMLILGVVFLVVMRKSPPLEPEDEHDDDQAVGTDNSVDN
jgi:hypothetical protein